MLHSACPLNVRFQALMLDEERCGNIVIAIFVLSEPSGSKVSPNTTALGTSTSTVLWAFGKIWVVVKSGSAIVSSETLDIVQVIVLELLS